MGFLSNTQAAYRFQNESFMARLNDRAEQLWLDGYRVEVPSKDEAPAATFHVFQECEDSETVSNGYMVNPLAGTCTCKFFTNQDVEPLPEDESKVPCKHLIGVFGLVRAELDYWEMRKAHTGDRRREEAYAGKTKRLTTALTEAGK